MASFNEGELSIKFINELLLASMGKIHGMDTEDREYSSILALWGYELHKNKHNIKASKKSKASASLVIAEADIDKEGERKWYNDAFNYWENSEICPISDDGVLGGYGKLTPLDTRDSNVFLDAIKAQRPELQFDVAADCGAGIGRVTKNLLLSRFKEVHLVEQSPRLLAAAPEYIGAGANERIKCIVVGLQDFNPEPNAYDVIWIQWVIGHLHELDFVTFFRKCAKGLRPGGIIALKDNTTENCTFLVDKDDSSVARHLEYIRILLRLAGLDILLEQRQMDFPEELFPVTMFALAPINSV
jgi:protein N-terminal methyltransferase